MMTIDITRIFKKYRNRWIALTDANRVICAGRSLDRVIQEARRRGYQDPVTMKVPDLKCEFILHVYSP